MSKWIYYNIVNTAFCSQPSKLVTMDTDAILMDTIGMGWFQVILVTFIFSNKIPQAWSLVLMSFGNYNPGWTCLDDDLTLASNFSFTNVTMKNDSSGCSKFQSCTDIEFNKESSTIVTEWGLICDKSWISSIIISIQMVGGLLGSLVVGLLSDAMGRKFALYSNVALCAVTNFIAVFSNSWEMFAALRFFIGFSTGGIGVTANPYPLEFVNSDWRSILLAIPDWNIGTASFASAAWLLKDWRHLQIANTVVSVICFLTVFWVPESIRWLAVRGKISEAHQVTQKICKMNKMPSPKTDIFERIAEQEKEVIRQNKRYTYKDLLRKGMRLRTFVCVTLWFLMAVSTYAIGFGIKSLSGDFYLNLFLFSVAVVPAVMAMPIIANKLGRKWSTVIFLFFASLMSLSVVLVFFVGSDGRGTTIMVLALLASVSIDVAWTVSAVSVNEIYPTVIRSLGNSACFMGARVGSIVGPYLIPKNFDTLYVSYSIIGGLLLLCSGLVLMLPETKGKSLEDVIPSDKNVKENDGDLDFSRSTSEARPSSETLLPKL